MQSTRSISGRKDTPEKPTKPEKPREDFPLFPHDSGRWAKKINGKFHYFGKWVDDRKGEAALNKYLDEKDDRYAGRKPRKASDGITIKILCDAFYTSKKRRLDTRQISPRTFQEYDATCERIVRVFGRQRRVDDLMPDDFVRLHEDIAKTRGLIALGNEIQRCRCVFLFAKKARLIDKAIEYGVSFQKPDRKSLRMEKAATKAKNGKRMLAAEELRRLLESCPVVMKAMVLLGINGGLGQSDIAGLPQSAFDFESGWLDYPRQKNGIDRRIPLWKETIDAVREAITKRPTPKNEADSGMVFLTRCGQRWVRTNKKGTPADQLGHEFAKRLTELGIKRPGLSYYALRHGFETIGGETKDQVAVNAIMGHVDATMAAAYREGIDDKRLLAVVNHVHDWLFPPEKNESNTGNTELSRHIQEAKIDPALQQLLLAVITNSK